MMDQSLEGVLAELQALLRARKTANPDESYVALMHSRGLDAIMRKLGEETLETILAGRDLQSDPATRPHLVHEAADLLFHLMLLLAHQEVDLEEVIEELATRRHQSGLDEKAARKAAR